jgi:hypothetical protein
MSAELVLSWTAFETLAGDLWEAAVNAHPEALAQMSANRQQQSRQAKLESKQISINELAKHKYRIRSKMGTILRNTRGNFQTVKGIADVYTSTFLDQYKAGKQEFWRDNRVISASAVRNVIVHCSGKVDASFVKQVKGDQLFSQYKIGDQFRLDGEVLHKLVNGLCTFAADLVVSVDNYLEQNPVTSATGNDG